METAIKELRDGLANTLWGTFLLYSYDTHTSPTRKNHQTKLSLQQHMRNVTSEWIETITMFGDNYFVGCAKIA